VNSISRIPAGLVDAGASSVATFSVGIIATRVLDASQLGLYAIFFSAWLLASQLPMQLILVPAEAKLVNRPSAQRMKFLLHNLTMALPFSLLASGIVIGLMSVAPKSVDSVAAWQLSITAALVTGFFPLQEHARNLLHLSGSHWAAAFVSIIRLMVAATALLVGLKAGWAPGILPFGSLALADLMALLASLVIVRPRLDLKADYKTLNLLSTGRWLLLSASLGPAAGLAVSVLIASLAGSAALGLAEAARVAAQPIIVLGIGLSAVLRPTSMEAAIARDNKKARSVSRKFGIGLALTSLFYIGAISLPTAINPLEALIPKAFTLSGLLQLSVIAAFIEGSVYLQRAELIVLGRTSSLTLGEASAFGGRVSVAIPSASLQSWAAPLGSVVGGLFRWVSFAKALSSAYRKSE
jgi:O-antigen/teichoic acid export membrane protein